MKILFKINPHSFVDVITNSSTELFVGQLPKHELQKMIAKVYPNYLHEYAELKGTRELTNDELECYISYHYDRWSNRHQKTLKELIPGFSYEEMYKPRDEGNYGWSFVTDETRQRVVDGIDPHGKMFFLFSLDDNPNWEMQERLMEFMTRYHLG